MRVIDPGLALVEKRVCPAPLCMQLWMAASTRAEKPRSSAPKKAGRAPGQAARAGAAARPPAAHTSAVQATGGRATAPARAARPGAQPTPRTGPEHRCPAHSKTDLNIECQLILVASINMLFLCAKDWINTGARTGYLPVSHRDGPVF